MRSRNVQVVVLDGNGREQSLDCSTPARPSTTVGQLDANQKLCNCHGRDRDVVVRLDQLVEGAGGRFPLGGDQHSRVEDQARH